MIHTCINVHYNTLSKVSSLYIVLYLQKLLSWIILGILATFILVFFLALHGQIDIAIFDFETMPRNQVIFQLVVAFVAQFAEWTWESWLLATFKPVMATHVLALRIVFATARTDVPLGLAVLGLHVCWPLFSDRFLGVDANIHLLRLHCSGLWFPYCTVLRWFKIRLHDFNYFNIVCGLLQSFVNRCVGHCAVIITENDAAIVCQKHILNLCRMLPSCRPSRFDL